MGEVIQIELLRLGMLGLRDPYTKIPGAFMAAQELGLVEAINGYPRRTVRGEQVLKRQNSRTQNLFDLFPPTPPEAA